MFRTCNCSWVQFSRGTRRQDAEILCLPATYHGCRRKVMSARSTLFRLAAKAGLLFGAFFVVTVLLAAIPAHRPPAGPAFGSQESASPAQEADHGSMPG